MTANNIRCRTTLCFLLFWFSLSLAAQEKAPDLTEISLEELMNITVTSASRKKEKLSEVAAAIYVITQEDIVRSGLTSIPEALRMVPGMQVAAIDANKWSISSRGFNGRFANKLLVLIDGRSVYTPLFSGVNWDVQDVRLEDIQRIEVIRGPGATLWGANAVNGVINIITKSAKDSQGGLVAGGGGTHERGFGSLHYGASLGQDVTYRTYLKGFNRTGETMTGSAADKWNMMRGGFRIDWEMKPQDHLTFQGDIYGGSLHQSLAIPILVPPYTQTSVDNMKASGGNFLARWTHSYDANKEMIAQVFFDQTNRSDGLHKELRNTIDFDFQHSFSAGPRHEIMWGLGYRLLADRLTNSPTVTFEPSRQTHHLISAFVQDEISILSGELSLILGSKFEYNDHTDLEVQPNARIIWTPHERHSVWGAVSRAIRTPSRAEQDVRTTLVAFPIATPIGPITNVVTVTGNPDFQSEKLVAYELGYRYQPADRAAIDFAGYYNVYHHLRTVEPAGPTYLLATGQVPHLITPLRFDNKLSANTYGAEVSAKWHLLDNWRLSSGYTWFKSKLRHHPSSQDADTAGASGDHPEHQLHLRSHLNVSSQLEIDAAVYYVDRLTNQGVPAYARVDARVGWHISEVITLSLVGQNLFSARHREFGDTPLGERASYIPRSAYLTLLLGF